MRTMKKFQVLYDEFAEATERLNEALKKPRDEFMRDSCIKRFELTFDLAWKAVKAFLEDKGVSCASPLGCFKEAYRQSVVEYEDTWLELVETRNKTVHTYDEVLADEIYTSLPKALEQFRKLAHTLKNSQEEKNS